MTGQRIADRYELLDGASLDAGPRLFRARDLAFGEIVAVKMIGSGLAGSPGLRQLEAALRHLQTCAHPALVQHHSLDAQHGILVREWVHGFSLLELIKRRHELPAGFALRLLDSLPAVLDFAAERQIHLPRQLLGKLLVRFPDDADPTALATQHLTAWPPFALKLNPISLRALIRDSEAETTMTTVDLNQGETGLSPATRLAQLLYEVLGGPVRHRDEGRFTPLPALREEGNAVLRRALLDSPYRDCKSLWADLLLAEPTDIRRAAPLAPQHPAGERTWSFPPGVLPQPEPATLARLTPRQASLPAIHLVARPRFSLGRSRQHADFIARFLPPSPANDELTNQLSRVHVVADCVGGKVTLRDGNGDTSSVNGSSLDDVPLDSATPTPLRKCALLTLGGVYSLDVLPLTTPVAAPLKFAPADTALPPAGKPHEPGGAVFFFPIHGQPVFRHAVWIFSRAGFGLDPARHLAWDTRPDRESPAAFFHDRGCFWLGNAALPPPALAVNEVPLAIGEIVPLLKDAALRIGVVDFTIDLS